ncbi:hypothetical protein L2E82_10428 [Cichorium intybus]|uniref:Uncharacterized protein n=1 Tax=Cichorium intybus TaxID=13427 RepID=A0ACB9GCJ0_CICIN|nr:hypothetical protein L2E82_10428 [Cichorium intybus]
MFTTIRCTPPLMEVIVGCFVLGVATIFLLVVWRVSNWLWFDPTKKKKHQRDEELDSSSYRGMFRGIKELVQMTTEANSKLISLTHDMVPRVSPFFYRSFNTHEFQCVVEKQMFPLSDVQICDQTNYTRQPEAILDTKIKRLQNKKILQNAISLSDVQINDNKRRMICNCLIAFKKNMKGEPVGKV